jgi:hypothetical protein
MSGSSPADLAVAFRSFARRMREAAAPAEHDPGARASVAPILDRLRDVLDRAATLVGAFPAHDVTRTGAAVADHIESVHPQDWTDERLDALRALALEAGTLLRQIESTLH